MKKIYLFLSVIAMVLIVTSLVVPQQPTNPIPDDLKTVFKTSCMACHANEGSRLAMSKVNFSKWDSYDSEKQSRKAASICKSVYRGSMPTKSFVKSNPGAILTDAQKNKICKWSDNLNRNR
ncbi:MAG: heme-binding domain-containing protein [Bacteroidales bacterium]